MISYQGFRTTKPLLNLPVKLICGLLVVLLATRFAPDAWVWHHHETTWFPVSLHTVIEFAAIVIAFLVFSVAWHTSSIGQPGNILIIGCGFLAVGLIDMGHVLSYKGMPDFVSPSGPEKAIQFWLAARYLAAFVLLLGAFPIPNLVWGKQRYGLLTATLLLVAAVFVVCLYYPFVWPRTFIAGQGLTTFKLFAEYGVIALSVLAGLGGRTISWTTWR